MRDHKFECRIDLSHPSFTPFWELANEIGRDCHIKPVESKSTPTKKRRGWTPAARRNASYAASAAVANGRRKASKEKVAAAQRMLMEAGQGHRINGAAA